MENMETAFLYQRQLDSKLSSPEGRTFNEKAAQEAAGVKKEHTNKEHWWNGEIEALVKKEKERYLKWKRAAKNTN